MCGAKGVDTVGILTTCSRGFRGILFAPQVVAMPACFLHFSCLLQVLERGGVATLPLGASAETVARRLHSCVFPYLVDYSRVDYTFYAESLA